MTATIVNAAPFTRLLGTQDLSTRPLVLEPEAIPTHLPKCYIYAQKGPTTAQLVSGDSRIQIYGVDSFDVRKKYANHATVMSNLINAQGNAQMIERILPVDAGPEANVLLSLDVLPTELPDYERNIDGSIKLDVDGDPIPLLDGQSDPIMVPGYKVKWVVSSINTVVGMQAFGAATIGAGTQTDADTLVQSQLYPIIQFKASSVGEVGNNAGIRLWAPDVNVSGGVQTNLMTQEKVYPIRLAVIRRPTAISSAKVVETIFGEQSNLFTLKKGVIDPNTDKQLYVGNSFLDSYQNLKDVNFPPMIGDFGGVAIYDNNVKTLVDLFYAAEKAYIDASLTPETILTDFTGAANESYLFNFVSGKSSQAYKYHSFDFAAGGVSLTEFTNIYAGGSSDGTMSDTLFAGLVAERVAEYNNPNSELLDTAQNVESIIYDSGFPLTTKYALLDFMAIRKDTFVVLGTHVVGGPTLQASEDNSVAIALRTRAQLYPESEYFGTPVMRAMIMGRSGVLRSSQFTTRIPTTFEVAIKSARYMGAGDGRWKNGKNFDGAPGSILDEMADISVVYTPVGARNRDWEAGLNWVQRYDRRSLFFPALKTVYDDDTSVLNSYFTALAICEINKVCERAWRHFSGVSNLSNAQLVERVNAFISSRLDGRFDGRFFIVPNTYFTDADIARGYSWTTAVKIYAPNMKTVMTTFVQAYRIEDYVPAA